MRDALPAPAGRPEGPAIGAIRVIGLGTRQGDDAAGLAAVERLAAAGLPGGVEACGCERPGLDLLDLLAEVDGAVIVDAMRSGGAPGSVRTVGADELCEAARLSTHALGVGAALALARALGRAPHRLELVGIEAGPEGGTGLSAPVARAIDAAVALVRERALAMRRDRGVAPARQDACDEARPPARGEAARDA